MSNEMIHRLDQVVRPDAIRFVTELVVTNPSGIASLSSSQTASNGWLLR